MAGGGGRGAKSYNGMKAWPSENYSILSGSGRQFTSTQCVSNEVLFCKVDKYVKIKCSVDVCKPIEHILFDTYSFVLL